jgi:hypothetical protein
MILVANTFQLIAKLKICLDISQILLNLWWVVLGQATLHNFNSLQILVSDWMLK